MPREYNQGGGEGFAATFLKSPSLSTSRGVARKPTKKLDFMGRKKSLSVFFPTPQPPFYVCLERKSAMNNMCPPFVPRDKLEVWTTVVHMAFITKALHKSIAILTLPLIASPQNVQK